MKYLRLMDTIREIIEEELTIREASFTAATSMHAANRDAKRSGEINAKQPPKTPNPVADEEPMSVAGKAKKLGLTYMKFGRWGKNGKVTHMSDGENGLRPV